ncbi:hypothetical protein GQ53DRAFT_848639 [Thozetella sp. PMI_491]|nr:hypothetical protein GQ53DRAFT_848639 [Thozetella sp. PMI_491]
MLSKGLLASLAGLAAASPLTARGFPPVKQAQGFNLIANVSDPSKDFFNPPIHGWALIGLHAGAGISAGSLSPNSSALFFVNGTARDVSAAATSIELPPLVATGVGAIPMGLQFVSSPTNDTEPAAIELNYGLGTIGAGILGGLRSPYPIAFAPFHGSFMVCNQTVPVYPNPPYPVRFAKEHIVDEEGHVATDIPSDCVAITFLAQCATLPDLEGKDELNITVEAVDCYEDVSSIDWCKY